MAFVDYYKILGVDKNIPQKDVRAAYRKRAKQFHPDLHPNDPKAKAKFQALNEAYEVISDPDKRAKYDQYGEQWKNADAFGGFGGAGGAGGSGSYGGAGGNPFEGFDFSQFGGGGGFSSFFENLFGGRGRSQQSADGFGSGNFGGFNGSAGYGSGFNGAGYGAGADFGTGGCGGGCGQNGRANNGEMNMNVNIDLYTALLGGEGIIKLSNGSKIKLKIKPETQNGTKVRVRGKGYDRGDGTFGDLMITYNVKLPTWLNDKQKDLLRQMKDDGFGSGNFGGFNGSAGYGSGFNGAGYGAGADFGTGGCGGGCGQNGRANNGEMNMNVNIDLYTALLGGEGIIKLSNGSKIKLKIKPETQNGTKVRVRGKGYDRGDGTFGDLMITYNVKLPTGLNDKQKDLLRQMKDAK